MSKVLIIEDDIFLNNIYSEKLARQGVFVSKLTTGEGVLREALSFMPDVIILDMILPVKSGFEIIEELKNEQLTKAIPIVVITRLRGEENIQKCKALGVNEYIIKSEISYNRALEKIKQYFPTDDSIILG